VPRAYALGISSGQEMVVSFEMASYPQVIHGFLLHFIAFFCDFISIFGCLSQVFLKFTLETLLPGCTV
jgi:hypothetical protein